VLCNRFISSKCDFKIKQVPINCKASLLCIIYHIINIRWWWWIIYLDFAIRLDRTICRYIVKQLTWFYHCISLVALCCYYFRCNWTAITILSILSNLTYVSSLCLGSWNVGTCILVEFIQRASLAWRPTCILGCDKLGSTASEILQAQILASFWLNYICHCRR
jgi:hypothetical protein